MKTEEFEEYRKVERTPLKGNVKLFMGSDVTQAESIDVSESGIRVVTKTPLTIQVKRETNGVFQQNEAKLVWARKISGGMEYGLEYT